MRDTPEISAHASSMAGQSKGFFGTRTLRGFIIATAAAPLLTLMGALGTDALPIWPRLAYWLILMESGAMIGLGVSLGLEYWGRLTRWPWLHMALAAFLIALPLTLVVVGTTSIFFRTEPPNTRTLISFLGIVFLISFVITALNYLMRLPGEVVASGALIPVRSHSLLSRAIFAPELSGENEAAKESLPDASGPPPVVAPRFADRLPLPMRAQPIIALQAEDHYLRVHTSQGSTLILLRLSDAVAELQADPAAPAGAQTHRSWWVSQSGVRAVARADGRAMLTLTNGIEAPVSRSHYKTLSARGWFR
jgi:DNA-binding LytR/AlgR family response regulator